MSKPDERIRCFRCRQGWCGWTESNHRCECGHADLHEHRPCIRISHSGLTDGKRFCMLCGDSWPCESQTIVIEETMTICKAYRCKACGHGLFLTRIEAATHLVDCEKADPKMRDSARIWLEKKAQQR